MFDARRMRPGSPLPADRRGQRQADDGSAGGPRSRAVGGTADRRGLGGRGEVRAAGGDEDGRGALTLSRAGPDPARSGTRRELLGGGAAAVGGNRRGGRV